MSTKIVTVFVFLLLVPGLLRADEKKAPPAAGKPNACDTDDDCGDAAEVFSVCNHVCGTMPNDLCTETTPRCGALSRKNPPDWRCIWNAPCRPPKRVWCENHSCKAE